MKLCINHGRERKKEKAECFSLLFGLESEKNFFLFAKKNQSGIGYVCWDFLFLYVDMRLLRERGKINSWL
jgi:hypothetical protein